MNDKLDIIIDSLETIISLLKKDEISKTAITEISQVIENGEPLGDYLKRRAKRRNK